MHLHLTVERGQCNIQSVATGLRMDLHAGVQHEETLGGGELLLVRCFRGKDMPVS